MDIVEILSILDRQIDYNDREAAEEKLNDCINVIGASAKLKSKAYGDLERAKKIIITKKEHVGLNTRKLQMIISAETASEQETYILAERINVSLFKTIDGLKSLLSIQKDDVPSWN